jgi:glycosyltransferase involved in cell wall biosynthesis
MKLIITTPPLNKPSGIATYARYLINNRPDSTPFIIPSINEKRVSQKCSLIIKILISFYACIKKNETIYINTALEKRAILRDLILVVIAKLQRKKVIIHLHGGRYYLRQPPFVFELLLRIIYRLVDTTVTLGQNSQRLLSEKKTKCLVVPNSANNLFHEAPCRNKRDSLGNTYRFLYVGRFATEKNLIDLCEIFKRINKKNISLHLIGSGPIERTLQKYSSENIQVLRPKYSNELLHEYDSSDFVIMNSSYEGMPMSLLEGLSRGCIPVTTNVGEIPNFIDDTCGYICKGGRLSAPDIFKVINLYENSATLFRKRAEDRASEIREARDTAINLVLNSDIND